MALILKMLISEMIGTLLILWTGALGLTCSAAGALMQYVAFSAPLLLGGSDIACAGCPHLRALIFPTFRQTERHPRARTRIECGRKSRRCPESGASFR